MYSLNILPTSYLTRPVEGLCSTPLLLCCTPVLELSLQCTGLYSCKILSVLIREGWLHFTLLACMSLVLISKEYICVCLCKLGICTVFRLPDFKHDSAVVFVSIYWGEREWAPHWRVVRKLCLYICCCCSIRLTIDRLRLLFCTFLRHSLIQKLFTNSQKRRILECECLEGLCGY